MAKRPKVLKRFLLSILIAMGVALLALAIWIIYLDRIVTKQFEGRRWTLPAQVYAQPLELYAGQAIAADELERELRRLGYRRSEAPRRVGAYRRRGARIDFISRPFRFIDEDRPARAMSVITGLHGIERMWDGAGKEQPIFRLDPLLIGSIFPIHGEDRVVVTPDQVPALLPTALKIVEDRKFDTHHGVDFLAILRATWANVRAGQIEQGASTLTQQLVRSYFLDNRRTFGRKIEEALMAMLLELHFDKADLMNSYINEIHLGQEGDRAIHGFGLASQFYFGKPLDELELHELATLVAVVRGPSYYDPRRHPERVIERRNLVLDLMAQFKVISESDARIAKAKPLSVRSPDAQANQGGAYYPAFLGLVRRTLRRDYHEDDLTEAGLKIFTTLDPTVQAQAERALVDELTTLDKSRKRKKAELEGVVVVTAPQSGEVIALVGGRHTGFDGFNRALDAQRSIGSLVKPVIYLAAMETGRFHAASIVEDSELEVKLSRTQVWKPKNFTDQTYGPVPLVRALAQSMNLASARLGMDVGLPLVAKEFVKLGLETEPPQLPAVLLGAVDVSPLQVAQIYNSLANGGFRSPLRAVRAVVDQNGTPLKSFPLEVTPVADPAAVYQVDRMMVEVMEHGSGRNARAGLPANITVAGKTGTSSDYRDSWVAGFSGNRLAVVWVGYDDNQPTGLTGSSGASRVWSRLMNNIELRSWNEPLPESLQEVTIDFATGYSATTVCSDDVIAVAIPKDVQLSVYEKCKAGFVEGLRRLFGGKRQ